MNLKILYNKLKDGQSGDTTYFISKTDDAVILSFSTKYHGSKVDRKAVVNISEYKGRMARITLQTIWKPAAVYVAPMYELSSKYREFQEIKNNALPIARVFIPKDEDCALILLEQPTNIEDSLFECVPFDSSSYTKSGIMIDNSKEFLQLIKRHIRKRDTICRLDIYNTVTYLESQVDALTRLVIDLAGNRQYANQDSASALKVLQTANKYNVMDVKPIDKILDEINDDKKDFVAIVTGKQIGRAHV